MEFDGSFDPNDYDYDPYADYDEHDPYNDGRSYTEDDYLCDLDNVGAHIEKWSQLRINESVIGVSTMGRVKPIGSLFAAASLGVSYLGTPYMIQRVGDKNYFVHQLVWHAFNGPVPAGKEIRHNAQYVHKRGHKTYSNRLECLECMSITVSPLSL